ncbi:MAG: hypothetical protein Kow0075_16400 [Salibacteraceae bacterium]
MMFYYAHSKAGGIVWCVLACAAFFLSGCRHHPVDSDPGFSERFVWFKSHPDETRQDVEKGVLWSMSFLGAETPQPDVFTWYSDTSFVLDLKRLGFGPNAELALKRILYELKQSEFYALHSGIDLGRFISLCLLSSHHYYAITGVPATLEEFIEDASWSEPATAVTRSTVSKETRIVKLPEYRISNKSVFVASVEHINEDGTRTPLETEVFDIMPNGQLRFGVYNSSGQRVPYSDPEHSQAGKPSKCLWCHETVVNRSFIAFEPIPGYLTRQQFNDSVLAHQSRIDRWRMTLHSAIDYDDKQAHTLAELLYLGFMEPDLNRVSLEWAMNALEVQARLKDLSPKDSEEFAFLKNRYHRSEVDARGPYSVVRVSAEAREFSNFEPNLLQ